MHHCQSSGTSVYSTTSTINYTLLQIIEPICSCPSNYFLNSQEKCECVPSNSCPSGLTWDADRCKCTCLMQNQVCPHGLIWDEVQCRCICLVQQLCGLGEHFDASQCSCVGMCPLVEICPIGLTWDPVNCICVWFLFTGAFQSVVRNFIGYTCSLIAIAVDTKKYTRS